MTANLLDVNFLIALSWKNHIHHRRARQWFSDHTDELFATCPITQSGFIRLSMNPHVVGEPVSFAAAVSALKLYQDHPQHRFWPLDPDFSTAAARFPVAGYRQVTDAYLLGLAVERDGRLITMDKKMESLVENDDQAALCLVIA